jgi:hypothetical protein
VKGDVGDGWTAAEVQPLELVAVQGKTLASAITDFLAVLKVQRLN